MNFLNSHIDRLLENSSSLSKEESEYFHQENYLRNRNTVSKSIVH